MKDKTIKIDLSKIANTALQEKVDKELAGNDKITILA